MNKTKKIKKKDKKKYREQYEKRSPDGLTTGLSRASHDGLPNQNTILNNTIWYYFTRYIKA